MLGKRYGWVVLIMKDDEVKGACITGMTLKRTQTREMVVAVLSSQVSAPAVIAELDKIFDMVVVKCFNEMKDDNSLLFTLDVNFFVRIVALCPGIAILKQSDHLFDWDEKMKETIPHVLVNEMGKRIMVIQKSSMNKTLPEDEDVETKLHYVPALDGDGNEQCHEHDGDYDNVEQYSGIFWVDQQHWETYLSHLRSFPCSNVWFSNSSDWTAIVGMSCRFPEANSIEEYWDVLNSGRNTSTRPPANRLSLVDMDEKIKANFLKCPIDQFDATFFGVCAKEAAFLDPQARLLMEVSWEAFENAGIIPADLKGLSIGVFCGSWLQAYKEYMNALDTDSNDEFLRKYLCNGFGCTAGKLSHFYGFTGPNISTESGCSSSMVAVDLACKSLQRRECPVALVAGANIILQFNQKQNVIWSEDGKSKAFDANGDGYGRAEGIAVLILKRYSDAIWDGDNIHGIIRGSAASQEGLSKSFGTPTVESEFKAMRGALRNAEVDMCQVDYLEAHATGTAVGDPIEAAAIVKAYTSDRKRESKLLIGSGKTNIGHAESCSGLAGIIKVLLAMKHETIPAHINLTVVNPQVYFEAIPGAIPVQAQAWPRRSDTLKPRVAGISSFGITGTDIHLILQETFSPALKTASPLKPDHTGAQIMTISAKSLPAFQQLCELYAEYLKTCGDRQFNDFIYTLNTGRTHFPQYRKALLVNSAAQAVNVLSHDSIISPEKLPQKKTDRPIKICFAFPGLIGNLNLQPARHLYKLSRPFSTEMDRCDRIWLNLFPMQTSLMEILGNGRWDNDTDKKPLEFYACLFAIQYSLAKLWKRWGVEPAMILGHSLGEISACLVSGLLSLEDVFKYLGCWNVMIANENIEPGAMLTMSCNGKTAQGLIGRFVNEKKASGDEMVWIDVAGVNAPMQTVVAGLPSVLKDFQEYCLKAEEIKCKPLQIDFVGHSRFVQPMWEEGREVLSKINVKSLKMPYLSSSTGNFAKAADITPEFLFGVFRNTVQFTKACKSVVNGAQVPDVIIEIGVGSSLTALIRENLHDSVPVLPSFQKKSKDVVDNTGLSSSLAEIYMLGGNINWKGFYNAGQSHRTKLTDLPHYPFQRKSFWFERKCERESKLAGGNGMEVMKKVHPLLGGVVSTALIEQRIYQNWMSEETAPYSYDHMICSHVILPAAGFLEMMLAVGYLEKNPSTEKSSAQLILEDFTIHKPLYLSRSEKYRKMQCIYDAMSNRVTIHACQDDHVKDLWNMYASGVIMQDNEYPSNEHFKTINISSLKENSLGSQLPTEMFYSEAAAIGMNFGPSFKSQNHLPK